MEHFENNEHAEVSLVLSNKKDAYVLERAKKFGIEHVVFNRGDLYDNERIIKLLSGKEIDFIILAGFLWLMPKDIISHYENRIVNIHPALIPKYCGKGMYGMKVHEAVVQNREKETGITIHYVNEFYDEGSIIFQAKCDVSPSDTPDDVANKVHALEHKHFPLVINQLIKNI